MSTSQILDVNVISILAAVALNDNGLSLQGLANENWYDKLFTHPWSIGNAVAENGEGLTVKLPVVMNDHLRRDLATRIDVTSIRKVKGLVLGERAVAPSTRVNPHSAGKEHSCHAVKARGLQHVCGSVNIEINCVNRILVGIVHIRDGGQVENEIAACRCLYQRRQTQHVNILELHVVAVRAHSMIDHHDFVARGKQMVHYVRRDKARTASDSNLHKAPPLNVVSAFARDETT